MEWSMKLKHERDNLEYGYNMMYYRARYGHYKKLHSMYETEDKKTNAVKYEIEDKKKNEVEIKRQEYENIAFEKELNYLLLELAKAKESSNRTEAINTLIKRQ